MRAPAPGAPPAPAAAPGRPITVEAAFWVTVAQTVVGSLGWMAVGVAFDLHDSRISSDRTFFVVLCLVGTVGHLAWMILGWRVRGGDAVARSLFVSLTGFGLAAAVWLCVIGWWVSLPGVVLLGAILTLLSRPSSNAWFRR